MVNLKLRLSFGYSGNNAGISAYGTQVTPSTGTLVRYNFGGTAAGYDNNDEVIFSVQYSAASLSSNTNGNNQQGQFGPYLGGTERNHKYMAQDYNCSWAAHSWFPKNDARYDVTFMLKMWNEYNDYYAPARSRPGIDRFTAIYPRAWDRAQEMYEDYLLLTDGETAPNAEGYRTFTNVLMTRNVGTDQLLVDGALEFIKKWWPQYETIDPLNSFQMVSGNYVNQLRIYPFIEHLDDPLANEWYWRSGLAMDFFQPVVKKFDMGRSVVFNTHESYRDIVLASLSETMLLYAEACIGRQEWGDAEAMINKVLARPGNSKDGTPLSVVLPTSSQQAALEVYLKESAKELYGQYCGRWPELRRTKMLKFMVYKYNFDFRQGGRLEGDPIGNKLYRPIPEGAMEINEGISAADQNPGY